MLLLDAQSNYLIMLVLNALINNFCLLQQIRSLKKNKYARYGKQEKRRKEKS